LKRGNLMKRSRRVVHILVLLFAIIPAAAFAGQFDKEWNHCLSAIRSNYYAIGTKGKLIEDLIRKHAPAIQQAGSREQFQKIVNEMLKETGDSHFELLTNEDQLYYPMESRVRGSHSTKMPFIGALISRSPQGWKVKGIFPGTSAAKAGLRKGDLVATVNGKPFNPIQSLAKLDGKAEFEIIRKDGKLRIEMEVKKMDFFEAALESTRKSVRIIEKDGKKIGYIQLWQMIDPRSLQLMIESMTIALANTDAMIVDLRDGFGGSADGYPDVFFRPAVITERDSTNIKDRRIYGYAKPLVLLINENTGSAKEVFTYMMKASKRATLVGSRTAGMLLTGTGVRINSWAILLIPCRNVLLDGNRIEGVGIEPDIAVKAEYGPDGEDLVIHEALRILTNQ
jgi:carboxyl-terminal processing protease